MSALPEISSYGDYASGNYGAHCLRVDFDNLTLWYSYKTVIAFRAEGGLRVSENIWGPTTGKHINLIEPDKSARLPRAEFEQDLKEQLQRLGLSD